MIKLNISKEDFFQLETWQKEHPHPHVRRKALVLIMKYHQTPHQQIAKVVGICKNTVREYFYAYKKEGLESVKRIQFYQPQSLLKSFDDVIKKYFTDHPPHTIQQACAEVEKLTGIIIKNTQMRKYLKSLDMRLRKVNTIPAKADREKQKIFHDEQLQPRLKEAAEGKRTLYFMDAAHFVMGAFLGYLWCFTRLFVRTPSGRQRFNVLGAINAITKELITVTNTTYITSIQVCELLKKLAKNSTLPVTIVLDNARYQYCNLVKQCAAELNIELLFLPAYSPNLNLIERVWKFVKKECLNSKYYEKFSLFQQAIQGFLDTMHDEHHKKLSSLLTLNFQLFTEEQIHQAI